MENKALQFLLDYTGEPYYTSAEDDSNLTFSEIAKIMELYVEKIKKENDNS